MSVKLIAMQLIAIIHNEILSNNNYLYIKMKRKKITPFYKLELVKEEVKY